LSYRGTIQLKTKYSYQPMCLVSTLMPQILRISTTRPQAEKTRPTHLIPPSEEASRVHTKRTTYPKIRF